MTLPIAHAHIVVTGVSRDVRADIPLGDVTPAAADHNRKLSLVIEGCREAGAQYRGSMTDLRVSKSRENRWILGLGSFCFRAVAYVVQTDAKDLLRIRNHRQEPHLIYPKRRRPLLTCALQLAQRIGS